MTTATPSPMRALPPSLSGRHFLMVRWRMNACTFTACGDGKMSSRLCSWKRSRWSLRITTGRSAARTWRSSCRVSSPWRSSSITTAPLRLSRAATCSSAMATSASTASSTFRLTTWASITWSPRSWVGRVLGRMWSLLVAGVFVRFITR